MVKTVFTYPDTRFLVLIMFQKEEKDIKKTLEELRKTMNNKKVRDLTDARKKLLEHVTDNYDGADKWFATLIADAFILDLKIDTSEDFRREWIYSNPDGRKKLLIELFKEGLTEENIKKFYGLDIDSVKEHIDKAMNINVISDLVSNDPTTNYFRALFFEVSDKVEAKEMVVNRNER